MVGDLERRINELRFLEGIEKVEHVPYSDNDQFWVRFSRPIDMGKLKAVVGQYRYELVKFGGLPSKLPRKVGEVLWNGVAYVIVKKISFGGLFTSFLGFEPDSVAKIAVDLHSSNPIFITTTEEGIKILYDYLGLKYVPPPPPPAAPVKAATIPPAKPVPAAPSPVTPGSPAVPPAKPTIAPTPATTSGPTTSTTPKPESQPSIRSEQKSTQTIPASAPTPAQPANPIGQSAASSAAPLDTKPSTKKEEKPETDSGS